MASSDAYVVSRPVGEKAVSGLRLIPTSTEVHRESMISECSHSSACKAMDDASCGYPGVSNAFLCSGSLPPSARLSTHVEKLSTHLLAALIVAAALGLIMVLVKLVRDLLDAPRVHAVDPSQEEAQGPVRVNGGGGLSGI